VLLKVKKLHPDAIIPTRGSAKASGLDLYALEATEIQAGDRQLVKTGVAFGIPEGYEIQVRPRSGLSLKTGLIVKNSPGTVDQDYTGECSVIMANIGERTEKIKAGDRIAQAVLVPVAIPELEIVEELSNTERGSNGFGSSGV
jgi:dUTP pyrophosphatase